MLFGNRGYLNDGIWMSLEMPISLFIEHHVNGLAFYINGDLQFNTADEALYHEYLVIPAVALAIQRFPQTNLRVLICGGGDGLAARDVLRFPEVSQIDLVDYSPEVLELGRTVFKPYNTGSLESDRVNVNVQEAFELVSTLPDSSYHVVICDFTYPTCSEETEIYSREWFQQINRVLYASGVICTNGVSPENRTTGFWCLYQTLLAAELMTKPLQLAIPSFRRHGYGNWGFFLASPQAVSRSELEAISLPDNLQALTREQLFQAFVFKSAIADSRHSVMIHTLDCPQLFYHLLNPTSPPEVSELTKQSDSETTIDFLEIQELGMELIGTRDLLQLESAAQFWIEQIYSDKDSQDNYPDITQLLPVRHRYHSPKMTATWLAYLKQLLAEVDVSRLLTTLLERAQELPPQIARDLKQLAERIRSDQPLSKLPPNTAEFLMMLSVTLLVANLVTPDAVFAKGFYSGGSSGYSSNDSSYDQGDFNWKILGFLLTAGGGIWLFNLLFGSKDE